MSLMNSAFVTGAGGFIGRHLVHQLLNENVAVIALMMPGEVRPEEWGSDEDGRVRSVIGDIRSLDKLAEEIGPTDVIFHLAAVVSDWGAQQTHVDITVKGTELAIELALKYDAHFVVTTSVCAYASSLAQGVLTEDDPVGTPASAYEFCKQEQERVTKAAVKTKQLKATIIRPANVFGVGSGPWVNGLLDNMRKQNPCLLGSGRWDAGLVHVNNVVAMLIAAARSDATQGDVFNAADGFGVTWETYARRLAQAASAPVPKSIPNLAAKCAAPILEKLGHLLKRKERPLITRAAFRLLGGPNEFSIEKARKQLGYKPVVNFEEAMEELTEHFKMTCTSSTPESPAKPDQKPWVWVTGSASGLGRYITGQLLQRGYSVLATDLRDDQLQQVAASDGWPASRVQLAKLDITDRENWQSLFEDTQQQGLKFSHLLNIAGFIRPGYAYENTAQQMRTHLDINVMGMANGCDVLLPHLEKQNRGHIINVVSLAGFGPAPGVVAYCASKAAARSFSGGLAMDLALAGSPVKVTSVCPDLIATPMMDKQVGFGEHSRIVFSGTKPLTVEETGGLILGRVWEQQPMEAALPSHKAWVARLAGLKPEWGMWMSRKIEAKGKRKLEAIRGRLTKGTN